MAVDRRESFLGAGPDLGDGAASLGQIAMESGAFEPRCAKLRFGHRNRRRQCGCARRSCRRPAPALCLRRHRHDRARDRLDLGPRHGAASSFLLGQPLLSPDGQPPVTLGDVAAAGFIILLGTLALRHMSTLFAVTIFRKVPDDAGVRFAIVTLCRYAVLGVTSLTALAAVHLDLAKIGFVLAALGVGLGFGLQEIVSNFVCGIILLLERPIRIGDVVTVAGTTGKVDRINIRATTIINSDNQSMIVPNREFITGNLVNWTLKDKILRVPIKLSVAYGTDPEHVVTLLLTLAGEDADVMKSPEPSAGLEGFGESALLFGLYAFVPEPGLAGGVKHRLCAAIQRRFAEEGIVIPFPTHELHLNRVPPDLTRALESTRPDEGVSALPVRFDQPARTPPAPHNSPSGAHPATADEQRSSVLPGTDR